MNERGVKFYEKTGNIEWCLSFDEANNLDVINRSNGHLFSLRLDRVVSGIRVLTPTERNKSYSISISPNEKKKLIYDGEISGKYDFGSVRIYLE